MPLAARLNDKGTRHDGYYETVITAGSSTVFIDGLPAARQGDPLTPHAKP
ncbi:TPA: PAAR domain-containing protein, partial [Escherichia coli]|nr:PAAR domain-containing protein [Escherichia coli]